MVVLFIKSLYKSRCFAITYRCGLQCFYSWVFVLAWSLAGTFNGLPFLQVFFFETLFSYLQDGSVFHDLVLNICMEVKELSWKAGAHFGTIFCLWGRLVWGSFYPQLLLHGCYRIDCGIYSYVVFFMCITTIHLENLLKSPTPVIHWRSALDNKSWKFLTSSFIEIRPEPK